MTAPTADQPAAGYDGLEKLRRLRHTSGRLRKRKALNTDEVVATLRRLRPLRVAPVHRDTKRQQQPQA
jgi:hypothetical protein